uniref:hypothetical protein n=1 Tax=Flavobacterium sp. TaxID=239 RepID=UPI00404B3C7C
MKKAIIIFSVLFTAVSFNSCSSDDFENEIKKSNQAFENELDDAFYARGNDTINNASDSSTDPVILVKKD